MNFDGHGRMGMSERHGAAEDSCESGQEKRIGPNALCSWTNASLPADFYQKYLLDQ